MADHHAGADMDDGMPVGEQPCQTPVQPECCRAMTSCAMTFSVDGAFDAERPLMRESIASGAARVPASRVSTPDPPPPKA